MAKFLRNELHCDDTMDMYEGDYHDNTGKIFIYVNLLLVI